MGRFLGSDRRATAGGNPQYTKHRIGNRVSAEPLTFGFEQPDMRRVTATKKNPAIGHLVPQTHPLLGSVASRPSALPHF